MRAAYVPAPQRIEVGDFPVPGIREGEVLVRMDMASICGSDLHVVYHGFHNEDALGHPGYPGHEGVGEVVESRSAEFTVGQTVLTVPTGNFGGCFAEFQRLRDDQVVPLPEGDPRRLMMGQQLGTTMFAMRKFWRGGEGSGQGKVAAVIGAGSAGLFFLQLVRRLGFDQVVVSDLNPGRLEVAKRLGADVTVDAREAGIGAAIADVTRGRGADFIIEAAGFDRLRAEAVHALANQGTLGFYGFPEVYGDAPFPAYVAFRKSAVVEWISGAQSDPGLACFHAAVEAIRSGAIEVDYCTEVSYPLERIPEAIALAEEQGHGAVKIGIDIAEVASEGA